MCAAALVALVAGSVAGVVIVGDRPVATYQGPVGDVAVHLLSLGLTTVGITLTFGLGVAALHRGDDHVRHGRAVRAAGSGEAAAFPWDERIWSALPGSLANQIAGAPGSSGDHGALSPWVAVALLVAYVVVALGAGAYAFARRDA